MLRVEHSAISLMVYLNETLVIRHTEDAPFVWAGKGKWNTSGPMVSDEMTAHAALTHASYDAGRSLIRFSGGDFSLSFHIKEQDGHLVLSPQRATSGLSRLRMYFPADPGETVYGGGAQYHALDLRGKRIPLWVRESRVNERMAPHSVFRLKGEEKHPSQCPVPFFFTGKNLWHFFDCATPAVFDFRAHKSYRVELFELPGSILIGQGQSPADCVGQVSRLLGRQPVVPQWALESACIEVQGGAEEMVKTLQSIKESGAAVGAIWIRDWTGFTGTGAGRKPFYDWSWNRENYPSLDQVIHELGARGIRTLANINPHFSIEGSLFAEASVKGYLVKKPQGGNYICDMGGFMAGTLDLTNVAACFWMKEIIKNKLLNLGFCGYMADMGHYLPADAVLFSGESAVKLHNQWPVMWAALNREVIREAGRTADAMFYTKTGWSGTGGLAILSSTGDHLAGWGKDTGLPSALTASLSMACSGLGLTHSDCGGNVNFMNRRSKELYLRWLDYAAFTPVLRVVRSAADSWQYDSDKETLMHFARSSQIHKALSNYIRLCVRENASEGMPVMRPMFMQFPEQPAFARMQNQYMLGVELLVAPVMVSHQKSRKVLLPEGHWIHLWTGRAYTGGEHTILAPVGQPPVFYKADGKNEETFVEMTKRFSMEK